jgi:hypothetical protein
MRVGDAERTAIADRLARHFVDGRLDEAEFDERLDRAMRATTMADLTGLLSDLPDPEAAPPELPATRRQQRTMLRDQRERERLRLKHDRRRQRRAARRRRARSLSWMLMLAAAVILLIVVVNTLTHSVAAWLLLGLIAFLWLRRSNSGYRGS